VKSITNCIYSTYSWTLVILCDNFINELYTDIDFDRKKATLYTHEYTPASLQ